MSEVIYGDEPLFDDEGNLIRSRTYNVQPYLPALTNRPTFQQRLEHMTYGLRDINDHIAKLLGAYQRTGDEAVGAVLRDLMTTKARFWDQEDKYREQEMHEVRIYFRQLPYSVRQHFLDEDLR